MKGRGEAASTGSRPTGRIPAQHGVWERIATSFDATRQRPWPHVVAFLESLPRDARVLDLMCGNGRHLDAGRVQGVGMDWSPTLAHIAGRRGPAVVGDATRLPFRDASFDACIYVAGWHGIPDAAARQRSVRELHRVLRPGAPAQVTVWSRSAPRFAGLELPDGPADVVVPWRAGGMDEPRTYHLATAASLQEALEAAGLRVKHVAQVAIAGAAPDNLVASARRI